MGVNLLIAIASVAVSAATGYMSYQAQKKSEKARARAQEINQNKEKYDDFLARRRAARERRLRIAEAEQSAENTGTTSSSGSLGQMSSINTDFGSAIGYQSFGQQTSGQVGAQLSKSAKYASIAQTWGMVGQTFNSMTPHLTTIGNAIKGA